MPIAELKTKKTAASVQDFLKMIPDKQKREDSFAVLAFMKKATRKQPKMWGSSIIGFGNVHLRYASGRELDWFLMGFSPRKQALTLYGLLSPSESLKKLGKYKTGKGCLYVNTLNDVDVKVLQQVIEKAAKKIQQ